MRFVFENVYFSDAFSFTTLIKKTLRKPVDFLSGKAKMGTFKNGFKSGAWKKALFENAPNRQFAAITKA